MASKTLDDLGGIRRRFESLSNFDEADTFDLYATEQVELAQAAAGERSSALTDMHRELEQERTRMQALSWLARVFTSRERSRSLQRRITSTETEMESLGRYVEVVAEMIDFTPNNRAQHRQLLKELRLQKKELGFEKKEINAAMREIRSDVRRQSAIAGQALGGLFYSSKIAATERRGLRRAKEAALTPRETQRDRIDRRIADVERRILWVERFGLSEE